MSCSLNTLAGIMGSCENSMGGIIEVYINHFDQIDEVTVASDKISAITLKASGEKFHKYNFKRNTGSLTSTYTIDPANGVSFVTSDLSLVFAKQDTAKRIEISALALDDLVIIVKDANSKYWYLGYNEPVQASAATAQTGTARTDGNSYTITLQDTSLALPYEVDAAAIASLLE